MEPLYSRHLSQQDTTLLRTPTFSPKMVISIHFYLCNQDTSQLRTAAVSARGVFNTNVLLYLLERSTAFFSKSTQLWQMNEDKSLTWYFPEESQKNRGLQYFVLLLFCILYCYVMLRISSKIRIPKQLLVILDYWYPILLVHVPFWKVHVLRQAFRWYHYFWNPSTFGWIISLFWIF
jgi:hypothetical protein